MPFTVLAQAVQAVDVTDGKALASVLVANFAAAAWGDLFFQLLVGIGTALIMGLTIYEKYINIRSKNQDWLDRHNKKHKEKDGDD